MVQSYFLMLQLSMPAVVMVDHPVKQGTDMSPAHIIHPEGGHRFSCMQRATFPAQTTVFCSLSLAALHPAAFTGCKHYMS